MGVIYNMFGCKLPGVRGPDRLDFPTGRSSAPVIWEYLGSPIDLTFSSGFFAATQDAAGVITPMVGWIITSMKEEEWKDVEAHTKYGAKPVAGLADMTTAGT